MTGRDSKRRRVRGCPDRCTRWPGDRQSCCDEEQIGELGCQGGWRRTHRGLHDLGSCSLGEYRAAIRFAAGRDELAINPRDHV